VVHIIPFFLVSTDHIAFLIFFFLTEFLFLYSERNTFCCWNYQPWF
jgi:hypothetical protein